MMESQSGWRAIGKGLKFDIKMTLAVCVFVCLPDKVQAGFTCGDIQCNQKGYDYCLLPPLVADGEPECWPCHIRRDKCGTTEEQPGCNLYCQDLLMEKMDQKHQREIQAMNRTIDEARADAAAKVQKMADEIKQERAAHNITVKTLNNSLDECDADLKQTREKLNKKQFHLVVVGAVLGGCVCLMSLGWLCCKIRIITALKQLPLIGICRNRIIELNRHNVNDDVENTEVLKPLADKSMVQVNPMDNRLSELVVG